MVYIFFLKKKLNFDLGHPKFIIFLLKKILCPDHLQATSSCRRPCLLAKFGRGRSPLPLPWIPTPCHVCHPAMDAPLPHSPSDIALDFPTPLQPPPFPAPLQPRSKLRVEFFSTPCSLTLYPYFIIFYVKNHLYQKRS